MILTALALLAGLWAGLLRLGWQLPPLLLQLPAQHGPLMVSGFLGTLISLERAVATLGRLAKRSGDSDVFADNGRCCLAWSQEPTEGQEPCLD
jgi:hypothetical protein